MVACDSLSKLLVCALTFTWVVAAGAAAETPPSDNPAAEYGLDWTGEIRWTNVVSIAEMPGDTLESRLGAAQDRVAGTGGIVYFPPGTYIFKDFIKIRNGVVIRGAHPTGGRDARKGDYALPTKFEFPRFVPKFEGQGGAVTDAFKGVHLEDPAMAANCGIVNVSIDHGHIDFGDRLDQSAGRNRIVHGCIVRNAAIADAAVPAAFQERWQRFTQRHHAAIHVTSGENLLVSNNRVPESDASFVMKAYRLYESSKSTNIITRDIAFDYDFRPGIYANHAQPGEAFGGRQFTPDERPWAFRKGIVIRDNYIFCTGSPGILFSGDGTICSFNVIRFQRGVERETVGGVHRGHFTNNIRAIEMRGWRWTVEGNDYEVHRNLGPIGPDGEGLLHEAHNNSTIKDSRLINNKGNAPISIWRTPVDGLLIKGNRIGSDSEWGSICVLGWTRNPERMLPCRNVAILENLTEGTGIRITGAGANNIVESNSHVGDGGILWNHADASLRHNDGYKIDEKVRPAVSPETPGESK